MKHVIFLVLFSIVFLSCKKNDDSNPVPGTETGGDGSVIVVSSDPVKSSFLSVDSKSVVFSNTGTEVTKIKTGTILVSDISAKAPYGFLRKVTSVAESNGKLVCQTTPASLVDAIKDGKASFSKSLTDADIVSIDSSGKDISGLRVSGTQSNGFKKVFTKTVGGVEVTAEVEIDPTIHFDLTIEDRKLKYFRVSTDVKTTARLKGEIVTVREITTDPLILVDYRLRPIVIWVEFIPIVFVPHIVISTGVNGKVTSKMTMQATANMDITAGVKYEDEHWENLNKTTKTGSKLEFAFFKKVALTAWIQPSLGVRLYDSENVQISVGTTVSLIGELIDSDYCGTLDWGIDVTGKVFMKLLDQKMFDYTGKIYSDKFQIFKGKPSDIRGEVKVGDEAFGGLVFYVEPNGKHGLAMVKPEVLGQFTASWWPDKAPYVTPGNFNLPTDMSVGAGPGNTKKLIGSGATPYIAGICNDLVIQDCYDDWFLPSVGELLEIYKNAGKLPGFSASGGVSSNLEDVNNAGILIKVKTVNLFDGAIGAAYLTDPQLQRRIDFKSSFIPIRSF